MCVYTKRMCVCMHAGFIVLLMVDVKARENGCFFLPIPCTVTMHILTLKVFYTHYKLPSFVLLDFIACTPPHPPPHTPLTPQPPTHPQSNKQLQKQCQMYTLNGHRFSETEPNVWNTNDPPPPDLDVCVTLNRVDDFPRAVLPATVGQQAGQIKGRSPICEQLRDHTAAKNKCVLLLLHTAKRSAKDHSRSQDKVISHNYKQKYVQRKPVFFVC